jgi:hypothetical protein
MSIDPARRASWAVSFAWRTTGDGSLAMVLLSGKYAAAATAAERAPFTAGAEVLIALDDGRDRGSADPRHPAGLPLLILGDVCQTGLAWLGVAAGAIGVVAQVLPPVFGWAHVPCGVLLPVWLIGIAFALWALGSRHCATANWRLQKR